MLHKKQPASVYVFEQPQPKLALLTVSSTPPTGEYLVRVRVRVSSP